MPFNERSEPTVTVVAASDSSRSGNWGDSINIPRARDRLYEFFERQQTPQEVYGTLAAALNGDLHYQSLLFMAMFDTWPKLQKNTNEILREVSVAPWKVQPYCERGEKPDKSAEKFAKEIEAIIWGMRPDAARLEDGFEDMVIALGRSYWTGHQVCEIRLYQSKDGTWKPRSTKIVPARYYGYPYDEKDEDPEDRLMFDPDGSQGARNFIDFPENRFLIGINRGHDGHPSMAAPLRALAAYWLAAVYGLKWFMNFSQLYGVPWRHGKTDDKGEQNKVAQALANIGSAGYIVTDSQTTIDTIGAASSGAGKPSQDLIELADRQCDIFILGQTLTSGTDKSGSRALGEVHGDTRKSMVAAVADHVGKILTYQLVPSISRINWGDREDLPQIWAKEEEVKDEMKLAERDEKIGITSGKVPVTKAYFYERHGIPMPAAGDELLVAEVEKEPNPPIDPEEAEDLPEDADPDKPKEDVKAADASITWRLFPASSGSLNIPRSEMPQIASGNRAALAAFLKKRGIDSTSEEVQADTLKPTQAEYSPEKVESARNYKGGNRSILISADNHVVDGHHQWMAAGSDSIKVIRLKAPIARVLMMIHRMPSTTVAASIREDYDPDAPASPRAGANKKSTVDRLAENVGTGLTGYAREWLAPIMPSLIRLIALAESNQITDEDFVAELQKMQRAAPEMMDLVDSQGLEDVLMAVISTGALAGSVSRYES